MKIAPFIIALVVIASTTVTSLLAYGRAREAVDVLVECNQVLTRCVTTLERARLLCDRGESP